MGSLEYQKSTNCTKTYKIELSFKLSGLVFIEVPRYLNLIGVQIPMKIQVDVWNYCDPITRKVRHVLEKDGCHVIFSWLWSFLLDYIKQEKYETFP